MFFETTDPISETICPIFVRANPIFVRANPIFVRANPIFVRANPIFVRANPIFVWEPIRFLRPIQKSARVDEGNWSEGKVTLSWEMWENWIWIVDLLYCALPACEP